MGRSPYQSEKRRKELARLQKQEEKRQRRFAKRHASADGAAEGGATDTGQPADAPPAGGGDAALAANPAEEAKPEGSPGAGTPAS